MAPTRFHTGRLTPYGHLILRLSWPAAVEQALAILAGMAFMMLTGRISAGALAASGTVNAIITLLQAALTMLSTGAAVLSARLTGARSDTEARDVSEQSALLALLLGAGLAALCLAFSALLLRLLMPSADAALYADTLLLLRVAAIGFPGLTGYAVLTGILRGAGDMRSPMLLSFLVNGMMLAAAWLFTGTLRMGLAGAGIAMSLARTLGGAAALVPLVRTHRRLPVRLRACLRPVPAVMKRILRLGVPASVEQVAIQGGYLLQGALVLTLGTMAATAYHTVLSVNNLVALPANVFSLVLTTMVGSHLGAREYDRARLVSRGMLRACCGITLAAALTIALVGGTFSRLYTASAAAAEESARLIWLLVAACVPMAAINCLLSTLRAAGDVRYAMKVCVLGTWCVRVPLTWLLLRFTTLGAAGSIAAMAADFTFRAALLYLRYRQDGWLHIAV